MKEVKKDCRKNGAEFDRYSAEEYRRRIADTESRAKAGLIKLHMAKPEQEVEEVDLPYLTFDISDDEGVEVTTGSGNGQAAAAGGFDADHVSQRQWV